MKTFTLYELKLADELAFPEDMERLLKRYCPETWSCYHYDFMYNHKMSLMHMIFHFSRADFDRGLGDMFENIVTDLLPKK